MVILITFPTLPTARLTSPFGWRTHPVTGVQSFHHGIDLAPEIPGTTGVPIYATQDGIVKEAGFRSISGYCIVVQHTADSYTTSYLHLASGSLLVAVNDAVVSGQQIATMGDSGRVTGIHLDFGVSTSYPPVFGSPGNFIDPQPYLQYAADPDPNEPPYYPGTNPVKEVRYVRKNRVWRRRNG